MRLVMAVGFAIRKTWQTGELHDSSTKIVTAEA
jgi:hypothetical protein